MKKFKILVLFAIGLLMVQCQEDSVEEIQQDNLSASEDIIKGLNKMGFNTEEHEVIQKKDAYLVEGDIIVPTESILEASRSNAKQSRRPQVVSCAAARNITVRNNIPGINREVRQAINNWNRVNNSFLRFRLVNNNNADININFQAGNHGTGRFPVGGAPGTIVEIDPGLYDGLNGNRRRAVLRFVIRHELGHNIGFTHTNTEDFDGIAIAGTPNRDANSTMNQQPLPVGNFQFNANLSGADRRALIALYNSRGNNICN